jgi:hypothetical protein
MKSPSEARVEQRCALTMLDKPKKSITRSWTFEYGTSVPRARASSQQPTMLVANDGVGACDDPMSLLESAYGGVGSNAGLGVASANFRLKSEPAIPSRHASVN